MKNKCCLYVIIPIRLFSVMICNLFIDLPSYMWRHTTCTRGGIQHVHVEAYSTYMWRHTACTSNLNGTTHLINNIYCDRIRCLSTLTMKKKLYNTHLECTNTWNSIWKYKATCVNQELNISVDNLYRKLNKKTR